MLFYMPYARRDADGVIVSLHRDPVDGAPEHLPDEHPEVRAFVGLAAVTAATPNASFAQLDADFIRVLEDVIDTLISKHLIAITDLPPEAQAKLFSRKGFRERRNRGALNLFDGADLGHLLPDEPAQG